LANPGSQQSWTPSKELNRTDADVSIFFLAQNSVEYNGPVDDPLFSAHLAEYVVVEGITEFYFLGDDYVNALGCIDQHQFCNPTYPGFDGNTTGCTTLTSYESAISGLNGLLLSEFQMAVAERIVSNLIFENMYYSVLGRGASALRASELALDLAQVALPNNQWTIEASGWFATVLARLQQAVVEYATGATGLPPGGKIISQGTIYDTALCHSQKVEAPSGYQNFSVLGIAIIVIISFVIILVGLTVDSVVGWCQKRWKKNAYGRLAWTLDEKLQLQRMAYEGAGWNFWKHRESTVPIYTNGEHLGHYTVLENDYPTIAPAMDHVNLGLYGKDIISERTSSSGH
jgi:hypothetical protein